MFILAISRPSSNMDYVGSKTRSPGQILGNSCLHSRGYISKPDFDLNLVKMLVLTISRISSNMGHVQSKSRSPGQILGKSCLHSRGQICNPILMKLGRNVCFENIQDKNEYGPCRVKNQVTKKNLSKFLFTLQRPHLKPDVDETSDQNVCFDNTEAKFENGSRWINKQVTRSYLIKFLLTLYKPHL